MHLRARVRLIPRDLACLATCLTVAACGAAVGPSGSAPAPSPDNHYRQVNLAANSEAYQARFTIPDMVNAWGIAIRPEGAGGHFWVAAGNASYEFVGDVTASGDQKMRELHQDPLKVVTIPGTDTSTEETSIGKATGVVFNGADINSDKFVVTNQPAQVDGRTVMVGGSARFIFATDPDVSRRGRAGPGREGGPGGRAQPGNVQRGPARNEVLRGRAQAR